MNDERLKTNIKQAIEEILEEKNFIAPVELLMKLNVLTKQNYEAWRNGKIPYLEKVCTVNLSKLSKIMMELRNLASIIKLKPSFTMYNRWGKGPKTRLRFSKSGNQKIEEQYCTHYLGNERIRET